MLLIEFVLEMVEKVEKKLELHAGLYKEFFEIHFLISCLYFFLLKPKV